MDITDARDAIDATDVRDVLDVPDSRDAATDASDLGVDRLDPPDVDVVQPADVVDVRVPPDVPPPPPLCPPGVTLAVPGMVEADLPLGNRVTSLSCQSNTGGYDVAYRFDLAARTGVTLSTDTPRTAVDTVLSIRARCEDDVTEIPGACNDNNGTHIGSFIRTVLDPGEYFVIVDQFGMSGRGGHYELLAGTFVPAPNAACSTGTLLAGNGTTHADITTGANVETPCRVASAGPQLFYYVPIPAGRTGTFTATPTSVDAGRSWRPVLRALDTCTAATCVSDSQAPMPGASTAITVVNGTASLITTVISVGATEEPPPGSSFDLVITGL